MVYITAFFFLKEGKESVFLEFEKEVLPLLKDFNGELVYRIRPEKENYISSTEAIPFEIHFLAFASELDFKNYTQDERRKAFMHLKEASIASTFIVKGEKL